LQDTHLKFQHEQRAISSKLHYDLTNATERAGTLDNELGHLQAEIQSLKEEKAKRDWKLKDSQRELTELDVQIIELKNQLTEQSGFQYLKIQVAGKFVLFPFHFDRLT
jgi:peptidoglycan hydrolase CwlO-like protein